MSDTTISTDGDALLASPAISLAQQAYEYIRAALLSGRFTSGQKLVLRPLAKEIGISLTPLRDALLRLVVEQALVVNTRGGVVCVPRITADELEQILAVRVPLEGEVAARAASRITDDQVAELRRIHADYAASVQAGEDTAMLHNLRFHRRIGEIGGARIVNNILDGIWLRLGPLSRVPGTDLVELLDHPHHALIAALEARDPVQARDAAIREVRHGHDVTLSRLAHLGEQGHATSDRGVCKLLRVG
ncbi:GntR family transcriptional regulator [Rhizosaccharibacter radicis]|uniref:GntR family transcriptional regulator n=1 Tax=Rhizosaccharibacter radicis TaxID=2782605 RepID=A0ABT1VTB9_9PROT|nr:GntR family transcriptional regulator [Acetobacteraceae bacterium KSS12]